MNRNVSYAQFHTPVFVSGVSLGDSVRSGEYNSRYTDCTMRCDIVGVYLSLRPVTRPRKAETFIPWSNVKIAEFLPEDTVTPTTPVTKLKPVA